MLAVYTCRHTMLAVYTCRQSCLHDTTGPAVLPCDNHVAVVTGMCVCFVQRPVKQFPPWHACAVMKRAMSSCHVTL